MGFSLKRMIQAVNPIAFACYFSGFEYMQVLVDYFYTVTDINKLSYNIFHNAGPIYDTVIDLIANFRFGDPTYRYYWQKIGNNVGYILKQIAYKPRNYDPFNGKKPTPTPVNPQQPPQPNKPPRFFD
jgi:hypothetical protein